MGSVGVQGQVLGVILGGRQTCLDSDAGLFGVGLPRARCSSGWYSAFRGSGVRVRGSAVGTALDTVRRVLEGSIKTKVRIGGPHLEVSYGFMPCSLGCWGSN